jgi:hypothetical protein
MSEPTRELSAETWRHIVWVNSLWPALCIVIFWAIYAIAAVFEVDVVDFLKRRRREDDPDRVTMYFWTAIAVTAVGAACAAFMIRRAVTLARRGVEVMAHITKVGTLSMQGYVRVNYEYWINGQRFCKVMSTPTFVAKEYRDGTKQLILIVDPEKPGRSMQKADVWPDAPPDEEPFEA